VTGEGEQRERGSNGRGGATGEGEQQERGSNRRGGAISVGVWAGVVPGVEVQIENLKDGGGGISDVLLINVIKGQPGSDRDLGKGGGGDNGGLRSVKRHLILN